MEAEEIESGQNDMDEDIMVIKVIKLEIERNKQPLILILCCMTVED